MLMYAANIYYWRRYQVNYSFIFGFKRDTELGYREVLLLAFGLAILAQASVLSNLDLEMDPKTKEYEAFTELIPLGLVVVRLSNSPYVLLPPPTSGLYMQPPHWFLSSMYAASGCPLYLPL